MHLLDEPVRETKLDELALEQLLVVLRVRLHIGRRHEPRRRIEHDPAIAIDDARIET